VFLPSSIFADEREGEVVQRPIDEAYEEGWTKVKQFTDDEVKEACRKYNNKLIGYYDELYKVVNCERRQVTRGKSLMQRSENVKVHIVAAEIVAKIPLGAPLDSQEASHKRSCKQLEGRYVTYTFTNIFIVKGCKLRLFPDWETFQAHRKKNNTMKNEIISLTENEFFAMRRSEPIASEIDKVFGSVLSGAAGVDVIPIDEACEGVEGKDVFYYSKIYRIQNCRKREYDPEQYVKSKKGNVNLKELSSSQWLSLPEGKPMFKKKLKGEG
jgi:hypothetical protein